MKALELEVAEQKKTSSKKMEKKTKKIASLKQETAQLQGANTNLHGKVKEVEGENTQLGSTVSQLEAENTYLGNTVSQLEADNTQLREELAAASTLANIDAVTAKHGTPPAHN